MVDPVETTLNNLGIIGEGYDPNGEGVSGRMVLTNIVVVPENGNHLAFPIPLP